MTTDSILSLVSDCTYNKLHLKQYMCRLSWHDTSGFLRESIKSSRPATAGSKLHVQVNMMLELHMFLQEAVVGRPEPEGAPKAPLGLLVCFEGSD